MVSWHSCTFLSWEKPRELPHFIFLLLSLMLQDSKLMLKLYYLRVPTSLLTGCDTKVALGRDPLNQNSNRSDREKRTTSKGGPVFSKLFRLDRTDPLSFGPKFPESLVEWIAPLDFRLSLGAWKQTLTTVNRKKQSGNGRNLLIEISLTKSSNMGSWSVEGK